MSDATSIRGLRPTRGLLALSLAVALAVPIGISAPTSAAPTREVLLGTTDSLGALAREVDRAGGRVVQTFEIARTLVAELPASAPAPQGSYVIPNMAMRFNALPTATTNSDAANTFKDTIDAPAAGGQGVTVAVVDTGVDPAADISVSDRVNVSGGPAGDGYGHGTFMAGLVAGDDADFGGVAPQASVLDVQVAATDGSTDLRRVLAGVQAVADKRAVDPSLEVAMLALSTDSPLPPYLDPLSVALSRLWARGVTVVVASGNDGPNTLSAPATSPELLVVGSQDENDTAVRGDDEVPDFSAYGRAFGFGRPDLVAPGVSLISTSPVGSLAYTENPASQVGTGYLKGSGTSMSAAVAAGAVAALIAERPALSPDDAKRLLVGTAYRTPLLTKANGAGTGGLDLGLALSTPLSAVPPLTANLPSAPNFGPAEQDADAWAAFGEAWADGDLAAVAKAWTALSPQTRKWAANAWSLAALVRVLQGDEGTFAGRKWAGRKWATQNWEGRKWAEDAWVGRKWADQEWLDEVWDGRKWAGRKWAAQDWLAFAWTLRVSSVDPALEDEYTESEEWAGRKWAATMWVGRKWAADAWDGRKWADYVWDGRKWAAAEWEGRKWADGDWEGRKWADGDWQGRKWADGDWQGRKWAESGWDGRKWADFAFAGRKWATSTWFGRKWAVSDW